MNTAKATVIRGTKAMVVVKVRLLAVKPSRSSRKRWRRACALLRHGKADSLSPRARSQVACVPRNAKGWGKAAGMGDLSGGRGIGFMAAMMPLR